MIAFRKAVRADLPSIIRLLADDVLGQSRETVTDPVDPAYKEAFKAIDADPNQFLVVAIDKDGQVVGCLQLSFIPGLSRKGMWRAQIESVRIAQAHRGGGLGTQMIGWAMEKAAEHGCGLIQLTSDKARPEAIRFYRKLGFAASHEGLKRSL